MSEVPQTEKVRKPGWQILAEAAAAILSLTDEEMATADVERLRNAMWQQVQARAGEFIPAEHEQTCAVEVLKAEIRATAVPMLSPWVTEFVLDRLGGEDGVGAVLRDLGYGWVISRAGSCRCPNPNCPRKNPRIFEATLAGALDALDDLRDGPPDVEALSRRVSDLYASLFAGRFGPQFLSSLQRGADEGIGAIMGDPIEVMPGEDLGDALRRTMPGYEVIEVGGPYPGLIEALLGRRRPESVEDETLTGPCECGTCPACLMRAADRATEGPASPDTPPGAEPGQEG